MEIWIAVLGFVGVISASVGTYLVARRKTSGSIDTSDATQLWAESQAMRKELRDEVIACRKEIEALKQTITELEQEKVLKETKIKKLLAQIKALETRIKKMEKSYGKS